MGQQGEGGGLNLPQLKSTTSFPIIFILTLSHMGEILDSPLLNRYPLFLKRREAKQLETMQHFDKALECSCFDTIKKFLGTLGKNAK